MDSDWQASVKSLLDFIFGENEAGEFVDVSHCLSMVKEDPPSIQAIVSIGVHVAILFLHAQEDGVKAQLESIFDLAIAPLEKCLANFLDANTSTEDEKASLHFFASFSVGIVLLAKSILSSDTSTKTLSLSILRDVAATQFYYGEGLHKGTVKYRADLGRVKAVAAFQVFFINQQKCVVHPRDMLFLLIKGLPYSDYMQIALMMMSTASLNSWISQCDDYDDAIYQDNPDMNWLDVFAAQASFLSSCQVADSSSGPPNECSDISAQHLAWQFGKLAGRFAHPSNRWHADPFDAFLTYRTHSPFYVDEFEFIVGSEKTEQALDQILTLLSEYSPTRDIIKMRERYNTLWKSSPSYEGLPLDEIGSHTDLYWAMRIGFLDALSQPLTVIGSDDGVGMSNLWMEIEDIRDKAQKKILKLTDAEILDLVENEESVVLERKASARWSYDENRLNPDLLSRRIAQTCAAFLNKQGGRLLIGVSDDNKILGLSDDYIGFKRNRDQYLQFMTDKLFQYIGKVASSQYISIQFHTVDNKDICLLDVKPSVREVFISDHNDKEFYVRIENRNQKLNVQEASEYIRENFPRPYKRLV